MRDDIKAVDVAGFGHRDTEAGLNAVDAAITTRRSVRAFLPNKPVPEELIRLILSVSARAASGTNIQPWHVHVVTGAAKQNVSTAIHARRDETKGKGEAEYNYYPVDWFEPYLGRRRKIGWDLYGLLKIEKGDREKTWKYHGRNYDFFDAPVGLFFSMNRRMERGSLIDMGMFIQSIMVSARGHGLDTCPQAAWIEYPGVVAKTLGFPDEHLLVCGLSLGYEDTTKPENKLVTVREPVDEFTTFLV
jgi:nitroreductase